VEVVAVVGSLGRAVEVLVVGESSVVAPGLRSAGPCWRDCWERWRVGPAEISSAGAAAVAEVGVASPLSFSPPGNW
jgi:hypothetical protein